MNQYGAARLHLAGRLRGACAVLLAGLCIALWPGPSRAGNPEQDAPREPVAHDAGADNAPARELPLREGEGARVLQAFDAPAHAPDAASGQDHTRRWVMFALGAPLLLLLLATGALGIAMGIYGKQVYVAHMICAGLSITLAAVHAIVGLVWFRPF
jgi:hypothetical protein